MPKDCPRTRLEDGDLSAAGLWERHMGISSVKDEETDWTKWGTE